jgi:hypothetical protein
MEGLSVDMASAAAKCISIRGFTFLPIFGQGQN